MGDIPCPYCGHPFEFDRTNGTWFAVCNNYSQIDDGTECIFQPSSSGFTTREAAMRAAREGNDLIAKRFAERGDQC